jgi:ABC-2 type transport system permease protein
MNGAFIIMNSAIKNNLRLLSVVIISIAVVVICVIGVAAIFITQALLPELNSGNPDPYALNNYLSLILFTTSIMSVGIFASVISFQSMTREKSRGNIQALLAAPLSPLDIWIGKTLAVFIPGFIFSLFMTSAALIVTNYSFLVSKVGFLVNPWMLISNLIAVPVIYLGLLLLLHVIGLIGKPATANVIAQVFLPVFLAAFINLIMRGILNAGSWNFTLIMFVIAVALGITALAFRSRMTTERIILSA